jgi:hypothetical protein
MITFGPQDNISSSIPASPFSITIQNILHHASSFSAKLAKQLIKVVSLSFDPLCSVLKFSLTSEKTSREGGCRSINIQNGVFLM